MSTEQDRADPSGGKSDASPSAPGSGARSQTALDDPDTQRVLAPDKLPQSSPAPDVVRVLKEGKTS